VANLAASQKSELRSKRAIETNGASDQSHGGTMKAVYDVALNADELPLMIVAESSGVAEAEALERATELEIMPDHRPRITFQGVFPDWRDFVKKYQPLPNPFDRMAACDSCLYGASGREWEAIRDTPTEHVWTVLESDDQWWIAPGKHFVNRLGYLIATVPHVPGESDYIYD
jgi:hypothetical protein